MNQENEQFPRDIFLLHVAGLQGIMEKRDCNLEEARQIAVEDCQKSGSYEHLAHIEAAFEHLKSLNSSD